MFNYYASQRKSQLSHSQLKTIDKENLSKEKRKKDKLLHDFVERTAKALNHQGSELNLVKKYLDPKYEPRPRDRTKNIGPPSFYFRDRSSIDRVREALQRNSSLDYVPFHPKKSPSEYQFREIGLDPGMKFTPVDTPSRVMEAVKNMKTNEIPSSWDINPKLFESRVSRKSQKSISPKSHILPSLNLKSHPKSFESIQNNINMGSIGMLTKGGDLIHRTHRMKLKKATIKSVKFETVHLERTES